MPDDTPQDQTVIPQSTSGTPSTDITNETSVIEPATIEPTPIQENQTTDHTIQQDLSNPSTPPDSSQSTTPKIPQQPEKPQPEPVVVSQPDISNISQLHFPFIGNYPTTFAFGTVSDNQDIKNKFSQWGIVGHNGIDFGLPTGTEVFPCDTGTIVQSGENGDFGISITIQHSWGTSLYAHLSEAKVNLNDIVQPNQIIGKSGSTGTAFGEHLHFAIKPNNPSESNGYLGFIDPSPFLSLPSQKTVDTQAPPVEPPQIPEQPLPTEASAQVGQPVQQEPTQPNPEPQPTQAVQPIIIPPPINYGNTVPTPIEIPQPPEIPQNVPSPISPQSPQQPQISLTDLLIKANQERQIRREENLGKIEKLIEEKKQTTNAEVCDYLHISRSTAIEYLRDLVQRGRIKSSGKAKATVYTF